MSFLPALFVVVRGVYAATQINNDAVGSCHPDVPNNVIVTSTATGTVDISWNAPSDEGASIINSYEISTDLFVNCYPVDPFQSTHTLNLDAGSTYDVAIRAVNAHGPGAAMSENVQVATRRLAEGSDRKTSPRRLSAAATGANVCASPAPCPSSASVTGDPITYFGNLKREFSLPIHTPTSLLLMPDMEVFATTFKGKLDHEQWINRIAIKTAIGEQIVQVDIKDCLVGFNRTSLHPYAPETLRISMDWMNTIDGPITEWPPSVYYQHWSGAVIKFSKLRAKLDSVTPHREVVLVEGRFAGLIIESASAREWYGEDELVTREYAHLDLHVINIRNISLFRGLLPELWGVREPSGEVGRATQKATAHHG